MHLSPGTKSGPSKWHLCMDSCILRLRYANCSNSARFWSRINSLKSVGELVAFFPNLIFCGLFFIQTQRYLRQNSRPNYEMCCRLPVWFNTMDQTIDDFWHQQNDLIHLNHTATLSAKLRVNIFVRENRSLHLVSLRQKYNVVVLQHQNTKFSGIS